MQNRGKNRLQLTTIITFLGIVLTSLLLSCKENKKSLDDSLPPCYLVSMNTKDLDSALYRLGLDTKQVAIVSEDVKKILEKDDNYYCKRLLGRPNWGVFQPIYLVTDYAFWDRPMTDGIQLNAESNHAEAFYYDNEEESPILGKYLMLIPTHESGDNGMHSHRFVNVDYELTTDREKVFYLSTDMLKKLISDVKPMINFEAGDQFILEKYFISFSKSGRKLYVDSGIESGILYEDGQRKSVSKLEMNEHWKMARDTVKIQFEACVNNAKISILFGDDDHPDNYVLDSIVAPSILIFPNDMLQRHN